MPDVGYARKAGISVYERVYTVSVRHTHTHSLNRPTKERATENRNGILSTQQPNAERKRRRKGKKWIERVKRPPSSSSSSLYCYFRFLGIGSGEHELTNFGWPHRIVVISNWQNIFFSMIWFDRFDGLTKIAERGNMYLLTSSFECGRVERWSSNRMLILEIWLSFRNKWNSR